VGIGRPHREDNVSSIARLSLRKRILIAVIAIAVVHLAFYAVPRVYCTWPRFHEAECNEAVGILKETIGAEAVERGIVTIPRRGVSLPYRGVAGLHDWNPAGVNVYMVVGPENFVIRKSHQYGTAPDVPEVWPLSDAEARSLFAAALYLEGAKADFAGLGPRGIRPAPAWFVFERSWPGRTRPIRWDDEKDLDGRLTALKGRLIATLFQRRLARYGAPAKDRRNWAIAMRHVLEALLPPHSG